MCRKRNHRATCAEVSRLRNLSARGRRDGAPKTHSRRAPRVVHLGVMGSIIGKITEEVPRHDVVSKTAAFEIRRYAPCVVAETTFTSQRGMFEGDQGGSFMRLARFIGVTAKPQNEHAAPISMTAPVLMSPGNDASSSSSYKIGVLLASVQISLARRMPPSPPTPPCASWTSPRAPSPHTPSAVTCAPPSSRRKTASSATLSKPRGSRSSPEPRPWPRGTIPPGRPRFSRRTRSSWKWRRERRTTSSAITQRLLAPF